MVSDDKETKLESLSEQIAITLNAEYGPMIGGKNLYKVLGYNTSGAFRQAVYKKTVPVDIFTIENRRGKFALSIDIARWLAEQKFKNYE